MELAGGRTWEHGLVRGLAAAQAPADTRDALINALGTLGCEAEYGLELVQMSAVLPAPTHPQGEQWLRLLFGLCQRVKQASAELAIAGQTFLAALAERDPSLVVAGYPEQAGNGAADSWSAQFDATPDVWWPDRGTLASQGDASELWLCRAGFGYRHVVNIGLPGHLEALVDGLGLLLHALRTLPPGGVLTRASLYIGVQALATEMAGDLIPHHIDDIDARHIGLLTSIPTLLRLHASEGNAITSDILWARGELERARAALGGPGQPTNSRVTRALTRPTGNLWARQMVADWERTVAQLEAIRITQLAMTPVR